MKTVCIACGEEFDGFRNIKYCPECRESGKRICGHCGKVFVAEQKTRYMCKECDRVRSAKKRATKKSASRVEYEPIIEDTHLTGLAEKAAEARKLGMSYGKYSAMRRGLLRV